MPYLRDAELAGRGQLRIRYTPTMDEQKDESGEAFEAVGYQEVTCEHVIWDRWGHGPARHWAEVPWVYFEHDLIRGGAIRRLAGTFDVWSAPSGTVLLARFRHPQRRGEEGHFRNAFQSLQARGLIDGGVDLILLETIFDTLNAKAAIAAAHFHAMK